jgi:DNA-binding response OmpR family regulator
VLEILMETLYSVLIADDDSGHREAIAEAVEDRGLVAHPAESGSRALDIVSRTRIHVGILDVHMPGLTGIETCRRLRERVEALPLILMSGAATEGLRLLAMDAGAASFLEKPLDIQVLLRTLEDLLRAHYGFPGLGRARRRRGW